MITIRDQHGATFHLTSGRAFDNKFFAMKADIAESILEAKHLAHAEVHIQKLPHATHVVFATCVSVSRYRGKIQLGCHTFTGRQSLRLLRWAGIEE